MDNNRFGRIGANWLELPRLGSWQPTRGGLGDLRSPEAAGQVGCCPSNDIVTNWRPSLPAYLNNLLLPFGFACGASYPFIHPQISVV